MSEGLPSVVTETLDSVAIIRFNRPAQRNPLSLATLQELDRLIAPLFAGAIKAVIFTGAHDVFASGADIRELAKLEPKEAKEFSEFGQTLFQKIATARAVTVAAINGYCMGGALDLALACDIRIASRFAKFSHPGARLGIITGWGGTQRLPQLIGRASALEFFATGRIFNSETALAKGLVTQIADPILPAALDLVAQLPQVKS
ncbi:MAG TPA: enoyl-CoA hydratase/isomerase family protein [Pyrinomonadaceae bacterium]|nr:enoyl-CoA hydratase/isomerase family protein [Pyrinomonadaceae bacterium]